MSKVIRINDETERLITIYRRRLEHDFQKDNMKHMDDILKQDKYIIQSALMLAIETYDYMALKSE